MNSIVKIIREELSRILKENDISDVDYELYDSMDEKIINVLYDFLFKNNEEMTERIPWRVVPFARLKKIWEDYMKLGFVRDEKGLDMIDGIMIGNAFLLNALTMLSGHTSEDPDDYFDEAWGGYVEDYIGRMGRQVDRSNYEDPNQTEINFENPKLGYKEKSKTIKTNSFVPNPNFEFKNTLFDEYTTNNAEELAKLNDDQLKERLIDILKNNFYDYYSVDSKGIDIMSDYGSKPLVTLAFQLRKATRPEDKVTIIDKMLNVVHQRSDMASWFVQGGSSALSNISGYDIPSEDGWGTESKISGKYKMHAYN